MTAPRRRLFLFLPRRHQQVWAEAPGCANLRVGARCSILRGGDTSRPTGRIHDVFSPLDFNFTDVAVTDVAGRCGPPYVAQSDQIAPHRVPCPAPKGMRTTTVPVVAVTFGNEYGTVALSIYAETFVAVSLMRRGGSRRTVNDVSSLSPVASLEEERKSGVDRTPVMFVFHTYDLLFSVDQLLQFPSGILDFTDFLANRSYAMRRLLRGRCCRCLSRCGGWLGRGLPVLCHRRAVCGSCVESRDGHGHHRCCLTLGEI